MLPIAFGASSCPHHFTVVPTVVTAQAHHLPPPPGCPASHDGPRTTSRPPAGTTPREARLLHSHPAACVAPAGGRPVARPAATQRASCPAPGRACALSACRNARTGSACIVHKRGTKRLATHTHGLPAPACVGEGGDDTLAHQHAQHPPPTLHHVSSIVTVPQTPVLSSDAYALKPRCLFGPALRRCTSQSAHQ